jgi:Sortase domain
VPAGSGPGGRGPRVVAVLVAVALAVAGTVAVAVALRQQAVPPPVRDAPPAGRDTSATVAPDVRRPQPPASAPGPAVDVGLGWSEPLRVVIPRLGVSSPLEDLGLDASGAMETPEDPDRAGWFTPNPPPGLTGAAVIAGHVTWDRLPAVFFDLSRLRRGDRVDVHRADGLTARFEVRRIGRFPKDEFPTAAVYGRVDHPGLRLITCGGVYDPATAHYRDNVIVWAGLVSALPTARGG